MDMVTGELPLSCRGISFAVSVDLHSAPRIGMFAAAGEPWDLVPRLCQCASHGLAQHRARHHTVR